ERTPARAERTTAPAGRHLHAEEAAAINLLPAHRRKAIHGPDRPLSEDDAVVPSGALDRREKPERIRPPRPAAVCRRSNLEPRKLGPVRSGGGGAGRRRRGSTRKEPRSNNLPTSTSVPAAAFPQ